MRNAFEERIQQLEQLMEETDSSYDQEKIQERIASLGGGVAKIKAMIGMTFWVPETSRFEAKHGQIGLISRGKPM